MVEAIPADRGGLARLHRLEELMGVGTAAFLGLRRVDAIAAHIRHASTSGGGLEDLIARIFFAARFNGAMRRQSDLVD